MCRELSLKMLKIITSCLFCITLLNSKSFAAPMESKAAKVKVDDVAFYKLGTYSEFLKHSLPMCFLDQNLTKNFNYT